MVNIKGFGSYGENEQSELETKLNVSFVPLAKDALGMYRDKFVNLITRGMSFNGKYCGLTESGFLILSPVMLDNFMPDSARNDKEGTRLRYWDSENPALIRAEEINAVFPISESYLDFLVSQSMKYMESTSISDYSI